MEKDAGNHLEEMPCSVVPYPMGGGPRAWSVQSPPSPSSLPSLPLEVDASLVRRVVNFDNKRVLEKGKDFTKKLKGQKHVGLSNNKVAI